MNQYNPNKHHRRSIRLKGYDYSQAGLYFITICCQNRAHLFGEIRRGTPCGYPEMILNDAGKMIEHEWQKLTDRFNNIELHEFVVMPNHFHCIFQIVGATLVVDQNKNVVDQNIDIPVGNFNDENGITKIYDVNFGDQDGQPQGITPTDIEKTVGDIIGAFKSITTVEYINGVKNNNWQTFDGKLWQRNYWEHIIRNDKSYQKISEYIIDNPSKWNDDTFYS
jgi:putative transposase